MMHFNTTAAQGALEAEREKLKSDPDQSWRADLPQRWAEFRRVQIEYGRALANKLLGLSAEQVLQMYGAATTVEKIHGHGREQLAHLAIASEDVEAIASGAREIADPYFCEGILRIYANAKEVDANAGPKG